MIKQITKRLLLLKDFSKRKALTVGFIKKAGKKLVGITPQDNFSTNDIAFGYLKNNKFLVATDFKLEIETGYASHGLLLALAGYTDDPDNPHPKVDYFIRGIVKHNLDHSVIFWEDAETLLKTNKHFKALQSCLKELKKRNLIKNDTEVYGSGVHVSIGTVSTLLK